MNFIFKSKQKTPSELVRSIKDSVARMDSPTASTEAKRKAGEDVSKSLYQIKVILYGDGGELRHYARVKKTAEAKPNSHPHPQLFLLENEPQPDQVAQLAQEAYNQDVLQLLVANIWRFEFEAKKDVSQIFNNLLRRQIGTRWPTVEYLTTKPDVIFTALKGYENAEVALNTGMILREMLRHESLAKILLHSDK